MKYFTGVEILLSVLYSLLLGAALGVLRRVYLAVLQNAVELLTLPRTALRISRSPSREALLAGNLQLSKWEIPRALYEVFEFLYYFFFGICYILLSYLALDGYFRFYTASLTVLGAVVVNEAFKKTLDRMIAYTMSKLTYLILCIFTFLLVPCRKILAMLERCLYKPLANFLYRIFCRIRTRLYIRRTIRRETAYFFRRGERVFASNKQRRAKKVVQLSQKRKGTSL